MASILWWEAKSTLRSDCATVAAEALFVGMAGEEDVEDEEEGADSDSGVGDIEGGPAIGAEKDFEEIGDAAMENAIGDVSCSSAEEEGESGGVEGGKIFAGDEQPSDDSDDGDCSCD